jgi:hypothetical protein
MTLFLSHLTLPVFSPMFPLCTFAALASIPDPLVAGVQSCLDHRVRVGCDVSIIPNDIAR